MFDFFNQSSSSDSVNENKTFVLSIGGSAIIGNEPNYELMSKLSETISSLHSDGYKFAIVVGGGKVARKYIEAARHFETDNYSLDELAIKVTRLNASLFIQSLKKAHSVVLEDVKKAKTIIDSGKIPVFGGLLPGFTTDAVASLVTEYLKATFVNLTNVDGVYDSDPSKFADAKLLENLSYKELSKIISHGDSRKPGENVVLDSFCVMVLRRSKLKALVLNAEDQDNLKDAIRGNSFAGTTISWTKEDEKDEEEKDPTHDLDEVEF